MSNLNCEYVRDVYPDALHGKMEPELAQRVREHVASCEECAAECALVATLHGHGEAVPSGLHERVLTALTQPKPRSVINPAYLAVAATVAVALIGGAILFDAERPSSSSQQKPPVARSALHVGAVGVDATMLSGKSSLEDLSVEQLEKLLGEMES
jgi:anti-sigma factor RsiW